MKLTYTILYVDNVHKSVEFYQKAFGLKHKFTHEGGDYAEMDTGEVTLAFCGHALAAQVVKRAYLKATQSTQIGSQISLYADNVRSAYDEAIKAGASPVAGPEIKPWGWENAMVLDIDGHFVEFAREIK
jgi:lactoylglutathione lyase